MGFFSKAPKRNPSISFEGIEFTFQREEESWEFTYRGTQFNSHETAFIVPTKAELDLLLNEVERLMPEMRDRLAKGLSEWGNSKLDDGESYFIDVQDFATDRTFAVSWSDGRSWGDLGVDFTIKDGQIIDESWGD